MGVYDKSNNLTGVMRNFGFEERFITGFWMDATEVTNAEYLRYVEDTKTSQPAAWQGQGAPRDKLDWPVQVSLQEAAAYAEWAGLRLPEYEEFCAAAASGDGVFPWRRDATDKIARPAPVGRDERDVSPLGIAGLAGNADEWGADGVWYRGTACRTAFCIMAMGGDAGPIVSFSARSEGADGRGFRCLDERVAAACLTQGRLVGGQSLNPPKDQSAWRNVRIVSELPTDAEVLVSNGQRVQCGARASVDLKLPPGSYMVTAIAKGGPTLASIWRYSIPAETVGWPPPTIEWRLSLEQARKLPAQ
jgi:hypothetical protein